MQGGEYADKTEHFKSLHNPTQVGLEQSVHIYDYPKENHNSNLEDDILNSPISIEEVYNATDSLDEHKPPGLDRVCPSALRHNETLQYLQALFQCCFICGSVPKI